MRVIAGAAKGRRLVGPRGSGTRPMMDRAKEAIFSSLGGFVVDALVLDLYAGSGSLGLEALSRGASGAVFVERARPALEALRANVAAVDLGGDVVATDVSAYLGAASGTFDLVFVDPPYDQPLPSVEHVLGLLVDRLAEGAVVILHRRAGGDRPALPAGFVVADRRRYGDAEIIRIEEAA